MRKSAAGAFSEKSKSGGQLVIDHWDLVISRFGHFYKSEI